MAKYKVFPNLQTIIILVCTMGIMKVPLSAQNSWPKGCEFSSYRPMQVSNFLKGALLKRTKPVYPNEALKSRVEGIVFVRILVNKEGNVTQTCSQGPDLLRKAAEDAAQQWKFKRNFGLPGTATSEYVIETIVMQFNLPSNTISDKK